MFVCKIDGPAASPGADIKNTTDLDSPVCAVGRGRAELIVESKKQHVMLYVCTPMTKDQIGNMNCEDMSPVPSRSFSVGSLGKRYSANG